MTTGYGIPLSVLAIVLTGSLLVVGKKSGIQCLGMLAVFPAVLFAAGWLIVGLHAPALPVLLAAGVIAAAGQTFLLLGAGATGRLAFLGAAGGYLLAAIIAAWSIHGFHITGIYSPLLRDLWYAPGTAHLDFASLALGAIALAGAGIIADLAVAVTATIREVHKANPDLTRRQLFAAGMRFGRDVIGTEINTLPFAIAGIGMGGILLVMAKPDVVNWPYTWMNLSNQQSVAVEISAMAAGTAGLALTIPLTALLVACRLGQKSAPRASLSPAAWLPVFLRRASPGLLLLPAVLAAIVGFHFLGNTSYRYPSRQGTQTSLVRGRVLSAETSGSEGGSLKQRRRSEAMQMLEVRDMHGNVHKVENAVTGSPVNDRIVEIGDRVIIRVQKSDGESYACLAEIERDRGLLVLIAGVCAIVVLVGGWNGWRALAALAASIGVVVLFLFVIVRANAPPFISMIGCAFAAAAAAYLVLCGFGRKTAAACMGVVVGLTAASVAASVFGRWLGLSGRYSNDLMALAYYSSGQAFDFSALLGASVLIGALGVTMDVSIAVASAVEEVHSADPAKGFPLLFTAGMSVGKKVLAAMFGAIFFASIGLNIGIFLLPWTVSGSLQQAIGNERVVTEIYRILIGGLAITWCVPAAALCSAWLASRHGRDLKMERA